MGRPAGLNAKASAAIAEIGKAGDWGLEQARSRFLRVAAQAPPGPDALAEPSSSCRARCSSTRAMRAAAASWIPRASFRPISTACRSCSIRSKSMTRIAACRCARRLPARPAPAASAVREAAPAVSEPAPGSDGRRGDKSARRAAARSRQSDPRIALLRKRLKICAGRRRPGGRDLVRRHAQGGRHRLPEGERPRRRRHRRQRHAHRAQRRRGAEPAKILANMEQWRWMPDDLGDLYVRVNIPEFTDPRRQGRQGHPHRARRHRLDRQADAGVLRRDGA